MPVDWNKYKKCRSCNRVLPKDAFNKDRQKSDGLRVYCRECQKEKDRTYRDLNKGKAKQRIKRWRSANRERVNFFRSRWVKNNPDKARAIRQRIYERHGDKIREDSRRYGKAHKDEVRARMKKWRENNPERKKLQEKIRTARKRGNGGSFTIQEWQGLCAEYDNCCVACGKSKPLTVDHVISVLCGGHSRISNIQPLCSSCNSKKHIKCIDYRLSWRERCLQ